MNVAVIGGGFAGLSAAVTLANKGFSITLFESAPQLGGRARTVTMNEATVDNGQHILIGAYRETLKIMELVGVDPKAVLLRLPLHLSIPSHFELKAPLLPSPFHLLIALLTTKGLSIQERIAAAQFMARMKRINFTLHVDTNVSELLETENQNTAAIGYIWEPLCIAALNTPIRNASAQVFLNVLRDSLAGPRKASDLLLPKKDIGQIFPEPAAQYIQAKGGKIHLKHRVVQLDADDSQVTIRTGSQTMPFDYVICATAPQHALQILKPIPECEAIVETLGKFNYQPIYTVYLRYGENVRLPEPMMGLSGGIAQWVFDHGQLTGQDGLLAAVISATGPHEKMDHKTLAMQIHQEISHHFGPWPTPNWMQVIGEKRATFASMLGISRPDQQTPIARLLLAGDYTASEYPATIEAAVRSGVKCAQLILDQS